MALDRTSGFDLLVQVSENELNDQIATAFLAGSIFPSSVSVPVNTGSIVGTVDLNFNTPVADLDRPSPQMGLTVPFTNSQLQLTAPAAATLAPLGGAITIVHGITVIAEGSNRIAAMDFNSGAPNVTVVFDAASQAVLAPALTAAGLTLAQAQSTVAGLVLQQLQTSIHRIDLSPPVPVTNDTNPIKVSSFEVTTVNDTTATDRDCIAFGVRMGNDPGGDIHGVTSSFIPAGSQSLLIASNFWVLGRTTREFMTDKLGLKKLGLKPEDVFEYDPNTKRLRLKNPFPAPGGQGKVTNLEVYIEGNRIRVDGRATDSGTGWSAVSNFTFFIDVALAGGSFSLTATTPSVDTDWDLEWWVWLTTLGAGAWIGGIIGAIVSAIVLAIVQAVAGSIANGLVAGGISGHLGGLPKIPLGPIGDRLTLTAVILDDLELHGSIIRSLSVPVKNQGSHSSLAGFSVDLDDGTIRGDVVPGTDLIWNPSTGLSAHSPAGLTVTGTPFDALTPVEISRLPLAGSDIPLTLIPLSSPPSAPFIAHNEVVFGVRTTEGRYAKVRAWRSSVAGGAFELSWVTYDTPAPQLDIAASWSVIEWGEATTVAELVAGVSGDCVVSQSNPVRRCGVFEAWPRLMAFPINYQWCFCGTVLKEGDGSVASPDGPLAYKLTGRRLEIETRMGQSVYCELCVSAIERAWARAVHLHPSLATGRRDTLPDTHPHTGEDRDHSDSARGAGNQHLAPAHCCRSPEAPRAIRVAVQDRDAGLNPEQDRCNHCHRAVNGI